MHRLHPLPNYIWSCLTTIFSCTWVAVHLNIRCPGRRGRELFQSMEPTSLVCRASPSAIRMSLLVPEYVLSWAIRQNLRARKISPRIKVNWTLGVWYQFLWFIIRSTMVENAWRFPSLRAWFGRGERYQAHFTRGRHSPPSARCYRPLWRQYSPRHWLLLVYRTDRGGNHGQGEEQLAH